MNIYIVKYNHGNESYIVAESFGEAEEMWSADPDRYEIGSITIVYRDALISDKLKEKICTK